MQHSVRRLIRTISDQKKHICKTVHWNHRSTTHKHKCNNLATIRLRLWKHNVTNSLVGQNKFQCFCFSIPCRGKHQRSLSSNSSADNILRASTNRSKLCMQLEKNTSHVTSAKHSIGSWNLEPHSGAADTLTRTHKRKCNINLSGLLDWAHHTLNVAHKHELSGGHKTNSMSPRSGDTAITAQARTEMPLIIGESTTRKRQLTTTARLARPRVPCKFGESSGKFGESSGKFTGFGSKFGESSWKFGGFTGFRPQSSGKVRGKFGEIRGPDAGGQQCWGSLGRVFRDCR
eukprot:6491281-Amphidinium_carterae.1